MAEVDAKPRASAQFGCVAGLALLLFAGALVATAQFGVEAPGFARRLQVPVPFSGVAAPPLAGGVAVPPVGVAAKKAPALNCAENAYLEVEAVAGSVSLTVKKARGFIGGQKLAIDVGNAQQENHLIAAAGPGKSITLRKPLTYTHVAGVKVCIQKLSLHQQFRHQFSTGSLDSLKISDSSTGSISKSSDSLTGLQFGSSADNLPKAAAASSGAAFGGSWAFNFIIMLCYACCYKGKVVDPVGYMQQQPQQHDLDDFQHGICDCLKDINMCCMVYFRIHIKDHMGIQDHCFNDMVLAACCLPCITGQQALSADAVMGVHFKCPCTLESASYGGYGGYGGPEQQQFNYS